MSTHVKWQVCSRSQNPTTLIILISLWSKHEFGVFALCLALLTLLYLGTYPQATSWIFQTNFINLLHFMVGLWFSYSQLLSFLPSKFLILCLLMFIGSFLFCDYMEAYGLDVDFSLVFITVPQSWKQEVPVLLWSLITIDRSKQHKHWCWCTSNQCKHGPRIDKRGQ